MPRLQQPHPLTVPDLEVFQTRLGYRFKNEDHLRLALTHPSVAHEQNTGVEHNQRLEFLGDAVLQLALTGELYEKFPTAGEGPLTKARAQMVNRKTLAAQAKRLDLGTQLNLSRGEEASGGRERSSTLADAFEALLGAVFIDGGFKPARELILREFGGAFGELQVIPNLENPKGELQEFIQATSNVAPQYQIESVTGPDHDRIFECTVYHDEKELGRGVGKSKKAAESQAARRALEALQSRGRNAEFDPDD